MTTEQRAGADLRADRRQVFMLAFPYDFNCDWGDVTIPREGDPGELWEDNFGLPAVGDPVMLVETGDGARCFGVVVTVTFVQRGEKYVRIKTDYGADRDDVRDARPWWDYDSPGHCDQWPNRTFGSVEIPRCWRHKGHDGPHRAYVVDEWWDQ